MSVIGGKADIREVRQLCPLMTHSGHRLVWPIPLIRHELRGLGLGVAPIHAVADLVTGFAQLPELPRSRPPVLNTWGACAFTFRIQKNSSASFATIERILR